MAKRITDKMRLDFLEWTYGVFAFSSGPRWGCNTGPGIEKTKRASTPRKAIDAAIRAERKAKEAR